MTQKQITITFDTDNDNTALELAHAIRLITPNMVDNVTVSASWNADAAPSQGFHDVIMVAFDLRGRSAKDVHYWLQERMPNGDSDYEDGNRGEIRLDSWWVANDERFDGSDCDSAVFVSMGKQAEARALLRQHGLLA